MSLPIENRYVSLAFKLILVAICAVGLYMNVILPEGVQISILLSYFTIQSNIFCLVYFAVAAAYCVMDIRNDGKIGTTTPFPRIKGAVVLAITITFLVYTFILNPGFSMTGEAADLIPNLIVHLIVPVMAIMDWILFDRKGNYQKYDPVYWLSIPLLYMVYIMIRAQIGGPFPNDSQYPYPFMDVDILGVGGTILSFVLLAAFFALLGYVFYFIDRKMKEIENKKEV